MSTPSKSISLQAYRLILYRRALHPELFRVKTRRVIEHMGYTFEAWIMPGSHMMRLQLGALSATELITDQEAGIPDRGLVAAVPCAGERDHEQTFDDRISYVSTVQTEQLPEPLYADTLAELLEFGRESDAMIYQWDDEEHGPCASILDIQRFRTEVHAQSYHLISQGGLVLRTQSLFEQVASD